MIRKILIANRGEVACRIIRTCREMGFATVAIFSDADENALHVELADEAIHIGGSESSESYLNMHRILDASFRTGADAIHPGYGFLAENAGFAYIVISSGLIFIGPPPEAMEAMGDKRTAKMLLQGVPFVPGYIDDDQSEEAFLAAADKIGYPIMIKASAGGGGKGIRQITRHEDMSDALAAARREARQAFGDDMLMLERAIQQPRHIEVQIVGDQHGTVIALGERECSIQRRHQKIIEESPSPALNADLRRQLFAAAISIGEQIGYHSVGTVEFLLDEDKNFYFMEMNTRLQVEHAVTELIYGVDLVRWQIEIARGRPLADFIPAGMTPQELAYHPNGHAMEVRVYAEDPTNNFLPVIGPILDWQPPEGVRTDSGIRTGDAISPYYDPMIAKIIAHGETRTETIRKLDYALSNTVLLGLRNNLAFLRAVLMNDEHLGGLISTHFIEEHPELLQENQDLDSFALIAAALTYQPYTEHWRNNAHRAIKHTFQHNGQYHEIGVQPHGGTRFTVLHGSMSYEAFLVDWHAPRLILRINGYQQTVCVVHIGAAIWVHSRQGTTLLHWQTPLPMPNQRSESVGSLRAPMPGQVIQIMVEEGQSVTQGAPLMIMEAMKMEHRIEAPYDGVVESIRYHVGDKVPQDAVLLDLTPRT